MSRGGLGGASNEEHGGTGWSKRERVVGGGTDSSVETGQRGRSREARFYCTSSVVCSSNCVFGFDIIGSDDDLDCCRLDALEGDGRFEDED